MLLRLQGRLQGDRRPGIGRAAGQLLVGDQLGLDDHARTAVDGLHLVGDGRDRPLGEGDEPGRAHPDGGTRGRGPLAGAGEQPGAQVEDALVGTQSSVTQVERLVVHEQPDDLAVGDVDDRLPGLRIAVARLRVGQRVYFVDAAQVGAGEAVGFALVEVAAPADVAVGEGEHGLALRQQPEVQFALPQGPGLDPVRRMGYHAGSPSSARSRTTMSAPWARRAALWPTRSTPTTYPKWPERPASMPHERVLEDGRRGRVDTEVVGRGQERVGARFAREPPFGGDDTVDAYVEEGLRSHRAKDVPAVGAGGDDRCPQPVLPDGLDVAQRPVVGLDPVRADHVEEQLVLAVAQAVDGLAVGRVLGSSFGELDAARGEEGADTVGARQPVHVRGVVVGVVEGTEAVAVPSAQEVVERPLPGGRVDHGGLGDHPVEVEEAGQDLFRQAELSHTGSLPPGTVSTGWHAPHPRVGFGRAGPCGARGDPPRSCSLESVLLSPGLQAPVPRRPCPVRHVTSRAPRVVDTGCMEFAVPVFGSGLV